jgi:6-phosphogluconolactonase
MATVFPRWRVRFGAFRHRGSLAKWRVAGMMDCVRTVHASSPLLALFWLLPLAFFSSAKQRTSKFLVYVGTYTDRSSKGIYGYRFDAATGEISDLGLAAESVSPSFLAAGTGGRFLYAVNETDSYRGQPTGSVSAFAVDSATGKLSPLNQVSARGAGTTHITLDRSGKFVLVANYDSGSVAVFPVLPDGKLGAATAFVEHKGSSVDRERQAGPHAHEVAMSPDNRFALVADLGLDQIIVYPFDAQHGTLGGPHSVQSRPGSGTRNLVFHPSGKFLYVINEISSTITTYAYEANRGELRALQAVNTLPKDFQGANSTAEIQVDASGKFLYGSNRGADNVAVYAIDQGAGTLNNIEFVSTQGKTPRFFSLDPTGKWLFAANQESNSVVVFRVDGQTGHLAPAGKVLHVATPSCVIFVPTP